MSFLFYLCLFLFLMTCVFLVFIVLIQESKSMGLGASFGGDSSDSLFGTSTADILKKITAYLIVIFMSFCIVLSIWTASLGRAKQNMHHIEEIQN